MYVSFVSTKSCTSGWRSVSSVMHCFQRSRQSRPAFKRSILYPPTVRPSQRKVTHVRRVLSTDWHITLRFQKQVAHIVPHRAGWRPNRGSDNANSCSNLVSGCCEVGHQRCCSAEAAWQLWAQWPFSGPPICIREFFIVGTKNDLMLHFPGTILSLVQGGKNDVSTDKFWGD